MYGLTLTSALLAALPLLTATLAQSVPCSDIHIFLAKGNNETEANQRQHKLVTSICSSTPQSTTSCTSESIHFTNAYETLFCASLEEGAANGRSQLLAYSDSCPESKIVILGYSQGAHVVGDILGGGGGVFFQDCVQKANPVLNPDDKDPKVKQLAEQIVAAVLVGDTRHVGGEEYNAMSGADFDGIFPRTGEMLSGLGKWNGKLRNYCVNTDPICASEANKTGVVEPVVITHLNYFDLYSAEIAGWVMGQVEKAGELGSGGKGKNESSVVNETSSTTSSADSEETESASSRGSGAAASTSEEAANASGSASASATAASGSGAGSLVVSTCLLGASVLLGMVML